MNIGNFIGLGFGSGAASSFDALPLPAASTENALFFGDTGTSRYDRTLDLPAGDWTLGMWVKIPTTGNASNVIFNAAPSATNPYSSANTCHLHYRRADGQFSFQGLDGSSIPFGQSSPPLPNANTNINALISRHPARPGDSVFITIVKTGYTAQMFLTFAGNSAVKTAEAYSGMGAISSTMTFGIGRDSSNPMRLQIRNFFKVSYALTEAQITAVAYGTDPTTLGTPAANDFRFLFDANLATVTSTINSLTMSRTFNNMSVVTGVGYAPQTHSVLMNPLGGHGKVIQHTNGSATFGISGRYLGASGGNIECRFIDHTGVAVAAPVTVATSITGGTWSGTVTVPKGKRWLRAQLRKIISGTPSSDVMTTSVTFGIGENIMLGGQSLQEHLGYPAANTTYTGNLSNIAAYGTNAATPNGFASFLVDKAPQVSVSGRKQIAVTGMANNGSGLIRVSCSGRHGQETGKQVWILGTNGTTEANGLWTINVVSTSEFDLVGSTFTNTWTSGGTVYLWNNSYRLMNNDTEVMPDGLVLITNAISELTDSVVCISNQAVGGQAIEQFNSFTATSGINNYSTTAFLAARAMGTVGTYLWLHGHQNIGQTTYFMDSGTWGSETGFGSLETLYTHLKTNLPNSNLKFGLAGFTNITGQSSATPTNIHEFRHGFKRWVDRKNLAGDNNVFFTGWYHDLDVQWENGTTQNAHLTPTLKGYQSEAARQGVATARKLQNNTSLGVGPVILSATRAGANIDLTVSHTGGSDLEWARLADGAIPSGFEVATDTAFTSLLTITNITRLNATQIRITLSANPGVTCYVRYQWGRLGNYASGVYGTARITGVVGNGSGLIRITTAVSVSPATPSASQRNNTGHGLTTGQWVKISDVAGATQANGVWQVEVIDATNFDLIGSNSVGLGTFVANSNLYQASATGVVTRETGIPVYDNQLLVGFDTLGMPLQPTYSYLSTGFQPTSISGNVVWLDGSDSSSIIHTSNAVSQWSDKSGSNYHFTQGTGSDRPMTNTRTINGLNALDFDGSDDNLLNTTLADILTGNTTIFLVIKPDAYGATQNIFRKNGGEFNIQFDGAGTSLLGSKTAGYNFSTFTRTADTNTHVVGIRVNGSSIVTFQNGQQATAGSASATTSGTINLGSDVYSLFSFNGLIGEVLVYTGSKSNSEVNQIGQYLAAKWGTAGWTDF